MTQGINVEMRNDRKSNLKDLTKTFMTLIKVKFERLIYGTFELTEWPTVTKNINNDYDEQGF